MAIEEEIGNLLKLCYKAWKDVRAARREANSLLQKEEIAKEIGEDTCLQIIIVGLLNGIDLEKIADEAQIDADLEMLSLLESEEIVVTLKKDVRSGVG